MSITVAIPIYNGERYIKRCLDSVLIQSGVTISIIIALDVSIDRSNEILEYYDRSYDNIKVIKKTADEKGLGKSRNLLINSARTEYIYFLDVDDFLSHKNVLYQYLKRIEDDNSDMLIGSHNHLGNNRNGLHLPNEKYVLSDIDRKNLFMKYSYSLTYSWNKLYRLSWLRSNEIFNKYEVAEDLYFFAICFVKARSLSTSSVLGLVYDTSNELSITNSVMYNVTEQKIETYLNMIRDLITQLDKDNEFDGLYLFSLTLWIQTIILRDGLLTGSLSLLKARTFVKQTIRIERTLLLRRRIAWEFQLGFKKYLILRFLLP